MPRKMKMRKHCVLVKYTGAKEVVRNESVSNDFRMYDKYSEGTNYKVRAATVRWKLSMSIL